MIILAGTGRIAFATEFANGRKFSKVVSIAVLSEVIFVPVGAIAEIAFKWAAKRIFFILKVKADFWAEQI